MTPARYDILGFGGVAVDDLLFVDSYPAGDAKAPVTKHERHCGGLTATALVAATRLGARCAFFDVLGDDELSRYVLRTLDREGVDIQHVQRCENAKPIHSHIVVDQQHGTRTIFYDLSGTLEHESVWPSETLIQSARCLFIDYLRQADKLEAARIAHRHEIPIVADLEGESGAVADQLFELVNHLIVSHDFASELTGASDPATIATKLWRDNYAAVVVTCGASGAWYYDGHTMSAPQHSSSFSVPVIDTTGCGDVFHGAYAAGLVDNMSLESRVRLANASAALKATQTGGQAGIPTWAAVERFYKDHNLCLTKH